MSKSSRESADHNLKKGPWTSAEDAILVTYVNKHGEGNWNAVQKHSGLNRCGKSCRLRWANHLRPDLKKGAFTPDEERRIIELHAKIGNKWARMAAELPGRTDNEIKNFWNTRIKRLLRAGLPIYPDDLHFHLVNRNQDVGLMPSATTHHPNITEADDLEIPEVGFTSLQLNQSLLYTPTLADFPAPNVLNQTSASSHTCYSYMLPATYPQKRVRDSESLFPALDGSHVGGLTSFNHQYADYGSPYQTGFDTGIQLAQDAASGSQALLNGSQALLNGISSSSGPTLRATKLELPSLQYTETHQDSWVTTVSPLPSLESVDTLVQSPPTGKAESDYMLQHNSGTLESICYPSSDFKRPRMSLHQQNSAISNVAGDVVDNSCINPCYYEWKPQYDPNSPLGHSTASIFNEHTPTISGISFDEPLSIKSMTSCNPKLEKGDQVWTFGEEHKEAPSQKNFNPTDGLLESCCFGYGCEQVNESALPDPLDVFLGESICLDD